ncbi:MAG: hypothetical protein IJK32_08410 [Bacteroidales bacterium]|nr:hypothetical protein [Bacteroidales bacterium]
MGFFTFPGQQEHRKFNYRPIYYDKDEEERRQVFGKVDGRLDAEKAKEKENGEYKAGSYIRGAFRDGNYARRGDSAGTAQKIIGIAGLILLAVALIYFCKFFLLL